MAVERKLVSENKKRVMMREFLHEETARAGFGGAEINRTPMGIRINLVADRPGFVIGRRGSTIKKLTSELAEKFDLEDPQIEVQESNNANLNPQIMAQKLADALERGWHFRRAGHSTLRRIMEAGAKGAQIIMRGKVSGGRARIEKFTDGHIKHCGETAERYMKTGFAVATKKLGTTGVTVRIMDPRAKLPDEIEVVDQAPADLEAPEPETEEEPETEDLEEPEPETEEEEPEAEPEPDEAEDDLEEPETEAEPEHEPETEPEPEPEAEEGEPEAEPAPEAEPEPSTLEGDLVDLAGVGPAKADALREAGFESLDDVRSAAEEDLTEVSGVGPALAEKIKQSVNELEE
jgi:small subunit ribosomal protein S3